MPAFLESWNVAVSPELCGMNSLKCCITFKQTQTSYLLVTQMLNEDYYTFFTNGRIRNRTSTEFSVKNIV